MERVDPLRGEATARLGPYFPRRAVRDIVLQVEWDALGKLVQVTVHPGGRAFDGGFAREVVERLDELTHGQDRALLLVDGRALQKGTPEWGEVLVGYLLANGHRFRIALYGARDTVGDLREWARSTGLEVAAFDTRDEAGLWLMERPKRR